MDVKLLQVDTAGQTTAGPERDGLQFNVRVLIAIDGNNEWHDIVVKPNILPEFDASLLVASSALQERLRHEQYALHRICKLVGKEVRGSSVRLPQQIAA